MVKFRWIVVATLFLVLQSAEAKPESWRDRAMSALMGGDYAQAIEYYTKWAEADPSDAVSLYNFACCLALTDSVDRAVAVLGKAADAGWSDSIHTSMDDDLSSLRTRPEYAKILTQIARNARLAAGGYMTHTCTQQRMGTYLVVLPDEYDPNRSYPLIVLLHGHGQSAEEFAGVVPLINPHDYIYAVPQGSYTAAETGGKGASHLRELSDFSEDPRSVELAVEWVIAIARDARAHYPIADSSFVIVGFSQGAALAHLVAARHPELVSGYAAHGGYLMPRQFSEAQFKSEAEHHVHVLVTHDMEDVAVEYAEAVYATGLLQQSGVHVKIVTLEKVGHKFTAAVGEQVSEWLKGFAGK
jgi:phospholipase/carboxylesterase